MKPSPEEYHKTNTDGHMVKGVAETSEIQNLTLKLEEKNKEINLKT